MLPSLTILPPFREDVTLEYAVSLVRRGHIRCKEHSQFPCSRQSSSFMPTRLVSISREGAPLRLVESVATTAPYATLSYCWGKAKLPSTTKTNLSARLHRFPDHSLPIVFHQAIQLARALEIPYIWIDSLCIIQDSSEDWEIESARMSLYYKNGSINIAAATSDNPDTPFFKHIDEAWCPVSVTAHDLQGTPSHINTKRLPTPDNSGRDLGTLFTRGWTFQESLFAPRTIYFTAQGVFWTCSHPISLSDNHIDSITDVALRPLPPQLTLAFGEGTIIGRSERSWLDDWQSLIGYYSNRLLTFPTDRLPAISGAAAQFDEHLHCPYLAGHWYKSLPESLIWSPLVLSFELTPLPRDYIAPSWSWASLTSEIYFLFRGKVISPAVQLVDVHCEVPGRNPYGRVSTGFIDLRGSTAPINVVREGEYYQTTRDDWDFMGDCVLRISGNSLTRAVVGEVVSDFVASARCLYTASITETGKSTRIKARPRVTHYALALGRSEREQNSFVRVGLLKSVSEGAMGLFDGAVEQTVRII